MDFSGLNLFQALSQKMRWLGQSQAVTAQNIANANTPGYKPRELEEFSFRAALKSAASIPARTQEGHLAPRGQEAGPYAAHTQRSTYETKPGGNAVVLEEQMMKAAKTAMDHQLVSNLYAKQVGMLRMVLGRGG